MRFFRCVVLLCLMLACSFTIYSQGCVAIRGNSGCSGSVAVNQLTLQKGQFEFQANGRYFKSFRHFRGDHEEANRIEDGTEVINHSTFLDLGVNYGLTDRLSARLVLPFVTHTRSSMYEHGGNPPNGLGERHSTSSNGLADMRLGLSYWLFNPSNHQFNVAVGFNLKLPTGSYDYKDLFYNQGENRDEDIEKVVDQSIQPGDGGVGLGFDIQSFFPISHTFVFSGSAFYLFNPRETNGVLTRNGSSEFSCPDQYGARAGLFVNAGSGFNMYLGGMIEGVPSSDAFGGSAGYRRPGHAVSVDPGVAFLKDNFGFYLNVPFAVYRNRTQSFQDKERTLQTGQYRHGDAAFADYLINVGVTYRLAGKMQHDEIFKEADKI